MEWADKVLGWAAVGLFDWSSGIAFMTIYISETRG